MKRYFQYYYSSSEFSNYCWKSSMLITCNEYLCKTQQVLIVLYYYFSFPSKKKERKTNTKTRKQKKKSSTSIIIVFVFFFFVFCFWCIFNEFLFIWNQVKSVQWHRFPYFNINLSKKRISVRKCRTENYSTHSSLHTTYISIYIYIYLSYMYRWINTIQYNNIYNIQFNWRSGFFVPEPRNARSKGLSISGLLTRNEMKCVFVHWLFVGHRMVIEMPGMHLTIAKSGLSPPNGQRSLTNTDRLRLLANLHHSSMLNLNAFLQFGTCFTLSVWPSSQWFANSQIT